MSNLRTNESEYARFCHTINNFTEIEQIQVKYENGMQTFIKQGNNSMQTETYKSWRVPKMYSSIMK